MRIMTKPRALYLGMDIYPAGFYPLLVRLAAYKLPLFILENGISTPDDAVRWQFIHDHLKELGRALAHGVPVIGYLYCRSSTISNG